MTARTRHAHPHGQPRRAWAPLDPDFPRTLPVFTPPTLVLDAAQVQGARDQFGRDLWVATRKVHGVSLALEVLAPRFVGRRRFDRRLRVVVLNTERIMLAVVLAAYAAVAVGGPVAYEVGL